jgi:alkanesulfonate monooxygenase SsuD/methylene tetrahydromethanopterin reductase-like flavin-dependent oxidoreductase (luciferase family)
MSSEVRQIILGATYQGIGGEVAWQYSQAGHQADYDSHRFFAQSAEEAKLDLLFYAETLSLFENNGEVVGSYVSGRPDSMTLLSAIASETTDIGFVATLNATYHDAWKLARQYASLEALSGGRSGWNIVTNAWPATAANFSTGDYLPREERYQRAKEYVDTVLSLWQAPRNEALAQHGHYIDLESSLPVTASSQGRPVLVQAGDSDEGRDFAAAYADILFTFQKPFEVQQEHYADIRRRAVAQGRSADDIKIVPGLTSIIADTDEDARELTRHISDTLITPTRVRDYLEPFWGYSLEQYDVDGPLPLADPDWEASYRYTSRLPAGERDARKAVSNLREQAEAEHLTMRQLVQRLSGQVAISGSPQTIAEHIIRYVQGHAADGFFVGTPVQPHGLAPFYERVIPLLQERKMFRTEYDGGTFRENLRLGIA